MQSSKTVKPKEIIRICIKEILRPLLQRELDWFKRATLEETIYTAAFAINNNDNEKHPHQRRLPEKVFKEAYNILLKNEKEIRKCKNFNELHERLEKLIKPVKGAGELYIYDTALRIGAKVGLLPKQVYLHRGTFEGAKKLGLNVAGKKTLKISDLPKWLQGLKAYEIENVLCIFKKVLHVFGKTKKSIRESKKKKLR